MARELDEVMAEEVYIDEILEPALAQECEGDPDAMRRAWAEVRRAGDRRFAGEEPQHGEGARVVQEYLARYGYNIPDGTLQKALARFLLIQARSAPGKGLRATIRLALSQTSDLSLDARAQVIEYAINRWGPNGP